MAPLRCAAKVDSFLPLDCTRVEGVETQSKERKGSHVAILQHWEREGKRAETNKERHSQVGGEFVFWEGE